MKTLKATLFAMMMFCLTEGFLYFFIAFCAWDLNWIPDAHWLGRAVYGILAFLLFVATIGVTIEYLQD